MAPFSPSYPSTMTTRSTWEYFFCTVQSPQVRSTLLSASWERETTFYLNLQLNTLSNIMVVWFICYIIHCQTPKAVCDFFFFFWPHSVFPRSFHGGCKMLHCDWRLKLTSSLLMGTEGCRRLPISLRYSKRSASSFKRSLSVFCTASSTSNRTFLIWVTVRGCQRQDGELVVTDGLWIIVWWGYISTLQFKRVF